MCIARLSEALLCSVRLCAAPFIWRGSAFIWRGRAVYMACVGSVEFRSFYANSLVAYIPNKSVKNKRAVRVLTECACAARPLFVYLAHPERHPLLTETVRRAVRREVRRVPGRGRIAGDNASYR